MKILRCIVTAVILINSSFLAAQELPLHVDNKVLYQFLDELALEGYIDVNDAVKPYSSSLIHTELSNLDKSDHVLNHIKGKKLNRYLSYFNRIYGKSSDPAEKAFFSSDKTPFHGIWSPLSLNYYDSGVYLGIQPMLGIDFFLHKNDFYFHRWGGALLQARMGDHFSFYASLQDNAESQVVSAKQYLHNGTGGNYKGSEYSEMRGGLSYKWDKGSISLVKDHLEWGSQYNGANIFSDRAPSFVQLKLNIKPANWFDFNYFHGWLVSDVVDSTRSYITPNGLRRDILHGKFLAANMYSFEVIKGLKLSFGNSVIYSSDQPHPAYLIPFFFYKSVDHWLNSTDGAGSYVGQNSQLFLNISSRNIKGLHLYGSLFVDEFKTARIFDSESHNFWSYKIGAQSKLHFIQNARIGVEYTRTNPNAYQHNIITTSFESNSYNLGHYLRDNSDELYVMISQSPIDRLNLKFEFIQQRKGEEYGYIKGGDAVKHAFMEEVFWQNRALTIGVHYEVLLNMHVNLKYTYFNSSGHETGHIYSPPFYQGQQNLFSLGLSLGKM